MSVMAPTAGGVGDLLRGWRQRRRLSELDLSSEAAVSARHLSFVETGRAKQSREMVLHLAEHLAVPLRERHGLERKRGVSGHSGDSRVGTGGSRNITHKRTH